MKKLILLLLFIPLVSWGSSKKAIEEEKVECFYKTNIYGEWFYYDENLKKTIFFRFSRYDDTFESNTGTGKFKVIDNKKIKIRYKVKSAEYARTSFNTNNKIFTIKNCDKILLESNVLLKYAFSSPPAISSKTESVLPAAFEIIEDIPLFPGCERVAKSQRRSCFQSKIQQHIAEYFVYPEIAQLEGIQGRVYVQFTIETNGSISDIRTKGPNVNLEKESYRIISYLPKMTTGYQGGIPTRVRFQIPITFKLQ